jgi:hypothetical protein
MRESPSKKSRSKREDWLYHVNAFKKSDLNQVEYCRREGISYGRFKYWRGVLLNDDILTHREKFVKIEKPVELLSELSPRSIQVKLVSGHVVYIPATLSMVDIGQLIRSLESAHA